MDDRAKPERLRFPRLPRKERRGKRGNARLRPHTHRQPQQQERIYIFDLKKGESGAGACAFAVEVPSCGKVCGAGAGPDQKAGPVFFAVSKKSSGPAALGEWAALLTGPSPHRHGLTQGRDGGMGLFGSNKGIVFRSNADPQNLSGKGHERPRTHCSRVKVRTLPQGP